MSKFINDKNISEVNKKVLNKCRIFVKDSIFWFMTTPLKNKAVFYFSTFPLNKVDKDTITNINNNSCKGYEQTDPYNLDNYIEDITKYLHNAIVENSDEDFDVYYYDGYLISNEGKPCEEIHHEHHSKLFNGLVKIMEKAFPILNVLHPNDADNFMKRCENNFLNIIEDFQ